MGLIKNLRKREREMRVLDRARERARERDGDLGQS